MTRSTNPLRTVDVARKLGIKQVNASRRRSIPLCLCLPIRSFFPPRQNENDRQTCVKGDDWPQQNPHLTTDSDAGEIKGHEYIIGHHPIERSMRHGVRPACGCQCDQADTCDAAHDNSRVGDLGAEKKAEDDWGIDKEDQTGQRFGYRCENEELFHCTSVIDASLCASDAHREAILVMARSGSKLLVLRRWLGLRFEPEGQFVERASELEWNIVTILS